MIGIGRIAEICALIGEPARANFLYALKTDKAISAGELAVIAGVANSTASEHLSKLVDAGLVRVTKVGRARHYRLASDTVADLLDSVEGLARIAQTHQPTPPKWHEVHVHARPCMDHIAGRLGCGIAAHMMESGYIRLTAMGPEIDEKGVYWMTQFGLNADAILAGPRRAVSLCPDWVENLPHLGGALGADLMRNLIRRDWIRRDLVNGKTVITPKGSSGFRQEFGLDLRATP